MKLWLTLVSAVRWTFLVVWTVGWILLAAVATLLTFNRDTALVMARRAWAPGVYWGSGMRFRPEALPVLDTSVPHIYVMNHQSALDIACAFGLLPQNLRFVAKHSLAYVPFLGFFMWMTKMIFINRSNRAKSMDSLRRAAARIREGSSIIVYPEGTRSTDLKVGPFKKGPFVLAVESQVSIIPVAIDGTGRILRTHSSLFHPGEVRMKVGAPIVTAGRRRGDRDAILKEVHDAIASLHREIGGLGGGGNAISDEAKETPSRA